MSFRERYDDLLQKSSNYSNSVYTRSTNMCRTILSLRSLLSGLLPDDPLLLYPQHVPKIIKRVRTLETLYPQADGVCLALSERRKILFNNNNDFLSNSILHYNIFENKIKTIFGYEEKVNWLEMKEVLTCHLVHGLKLPENITEEDIDKATQITGFMWGALYNVSQCQCISQSVSVSVILLIYVTALNLYTYLCRCICSQHLQC
jgi:hypothetical protein